MTEGLGKDDSVRAIVYRGAGTEAFASGADISEFQENRKDTETALRYNASTEAAYAADARVPEADGRDDLRLLHGRRGGARDGVRPALRRRGLEVRHPRRAAEHHLPAEAVRQLVDLVGPAYAKDILFSARTVDDREALAIGLIQRLVPAADLEAYTYDYLRQVADNAPLSVRGAKADDPGHTSTGSPTSSRARLRALCVEASDSEDYREGTRAFLEKRRAQVPGALSLVRFEFLSSTPPNPAEGSGTFVAHRRARARARRSSGHAGRPAPARPPHRLPHPRPLALQRAASRCAAARRRPRGRGRPRRLPVGAAARACRFVVEPQGHHRRRAPERARAGARAARACRRAGSGATPSAPTA